MNRRKEDKTVIEGGVRLYDMKKKEKPGQSSLKIKLPGGEPTKRRKELL